jgi:hypothetical protein
MEDKDRRYVVWSFEHKQWWGPNHAGYTPHLAEAGRYTPAEVGGIVTNSIWAEEVAILDTVAERLGPPTVGNLWAS